MDPLTDVELARILRTHPDVQAAGGATDFHRLAILYDAEPVQDGPLPPWCTPGGVFAAETTVDADGNMWRRWRWHPDAEQWVRDARASGRLT